MATATAGGVVRALAAHFLFATGILYREGVSMGVSGGGERYVRRRLWGGVSEGREEGMGRTGHAVEGLLLGFLVWFLEGLALAVLQLCEGGIHWGREEEAASADKVVSVHRKQASINPLLPASVLQVTWPIKL